MQTINQAYATRELKRQGYDAVAWGDTVRVMDPIQCASGMRRWTEYQTVTLSTDKDLFRFLDTRN